MIFFLDITFDGEYEAGNNHNIVTIDNKKETPEIEIKPEILADEENSVSSNTENQIEITRSAVGPNNQVESTRNFTLTLEIQAPPNSPRISVRPNLPRPSRNLFLQERARKTSDVQWASQAVQSKPKSSSQLKLTGQNLKVVNPTSGRVYQDRREKYPEMKGAKIEVKELEREDK